MEPTYTTADRIAGIGLLVAGFGAFVLLLGTGVEVWFVVIGLALVASSFLLDRTETGSGGERESSRDTNGAPKSEGDLGREAASDSTPEAKTDLTSERETEPETELEIEEAERETDPGTEPETEEADREATDGSQEAKTTRNSEQGDIDSPASDRRQEDNRSRE